MEEKIELSIMSKFFICVGIMYLIWGAFTVMGLFTFEFESQYEKDLHRGREKLYYERTQGEKKAVEDFNEWKADKDN